MRAVDSTPARKRIYDDAGNRAARWADPAGRDW